MCSQDIALLVKRRYNAMIMPEMQPSTISHEVISRPDLLTEQQLGGFLAGVGNHEGKALLLIAMGSNADLSNEYTQTELHELIKGSTSDEGFHVGNKGNQVGWCKNSMIPNGLASMSEAGPTGYKITQAGQQLGVPLAGFLLEFSEKHDVPLVEIFGGTASRYQVRSPLLRFNIISELLTHPTGASLNELTKSSGAADQVVVEKHLRKLEIARLIDYKDWDVATNEIRISISDEEPHIKPATSTWIRSVTDQLKTTDSLTYDELVEGCRRQLPDRTADLSDDQLKKKLISIVHRLEKRGDVTKPECRPFNQAVQASLTVEQESFWMELVDGVEAFRAQDPEWLEHYRVVANQIIDSPTLVCSLLDRAIESSAHARSTLRQSLGSLVLRVLSESESPLTIREIVKQVSDDEGRALSHFGIVRAAENLVEKGIANRVHDKVQRYSAQLATSTDSAE